MGNVSFGAPREIIEKIRVAFKVSAFVETGTYQGGTAVWASEQFARVYTIEGSPDFHRQARERHAEKRNVEFLLGDSRSLLREVVAGLGETPALFWLDAHWMPGSFGETHECPVLEEIAAIQQNTAEHLILIDDARLFLAPPPRPHRAEDWPGIVDVLAALNAPGQAERYIVIYDDVIFSLPESARETIQPFIQEQVTAAMMAAAQPAAGPVRKVLRSVKRRLLGTADAA